MTLTLCCHLLQIIVGKSITSSSCDYHLNDRMGKVNPMIIDQDDEIIYPTTSRTLTFDNGDVFGLYCHSTEKSHNYLDNVGLTGNAANNNIDYVAVTCKNGRFDIGTVTHFDIYGVTCAMRIQPRITKIFGESEPCANTGADGRTDDLVGHLHTVHIGFQVRSSYTKMIELCIDEKAYGTLWTQHSVYGVSIYENDHNHRPGFLADNYNEHRYFNFSSDGGMNSLYSINHQFDVVNRILGTDELPDGEEIIIKGNNKRSWNRGHISPDADFVMDYQQDATYFFINIAPQFGNFNQRNWVRVESACRSKSHYLRTTTTVTSGTYGSLDYPDIAGTEKDLWINWDSDGGVERIPVPKYYWKVLYDQSSHSAVAFLGLNDIYSSDVTHTRCPSVCDKLTVWFHADYEDEDLGHITCCDLESFSKVVPFAPHHKNQDGEWPSLLI